MSILSNPFVGGRLSISVPLPPAISGHLVLTDEEQLRDQFHGGGDDQSSHSFSPVPHAIFSELLMKHSQMNELRGILIAFAKARFVGQDDRIGGSVSTTLATLQGGGRHRPVGRIVGAIPLIHTRVSAEVLVFRPVAGQILKGVVTHAATSHIAILVLGLFTASVLQKDMAGGYSFEEEGNSSSSSLSRFPTVVGGKRSREAGGKIEQEGGGMIEDATTLAPATKKSRKNLNRQEGLEHVDVVDLNDNVKERIGGGEGGVWVKKHGQNEGGTTSSLTLSTSAYAGLHSSSSESTASSSFNRILASNPDRIQKGSEVVFVVTSVLHSVGVLTIQGSFVDPLYKIDQVVKKTKKKKSKSGRV